MPELAEQVLVEPCWHALAVTLADAESAGHDPAALLAAAAARRESSAQRSADSVRSPVTRSRNVPTLASRCPTGVSSPSAA
ncbi:hypothetical protein ACH4E5_19495 [Streptomyces afghaniensis]|uniref:hypothetical protein n=1 Tax=Streptomyces afghaniensis TaxID=66865 RepID=UPI0037A0D9BE